MKNNRRFNFIIVLVLFVCLFYILKLASLQIANGTFYLEKSERTYNRTVAVSAPRGEIFDRYGRPLVTNKLVYALSLDRVFLSKEKQGKTIVNLLKVMKKQGYSYTDSLPISAPPYKFTCSAKEKEAFLKALKFNKYYSAEQVMAKLIKQNNLQGLSKADARVAAGVLYDAKVEGFSLTQPFTMFTNIDIKTITIIKERSDEFQGAEITTEEVRSYDAGKYAAHILGRTGKIFKEDAEYYLKQGYSLNEIVGSDGIEKTMQYALRGVGGYKTIEQNISGNIIGSTITKAPKPGNDIYLSIDLNLQKVAEDSLEKRIKDIRSKYGKSKKEGWDADAGAAVVVDVKSGEVLALANYPTFDPATFNKNYSALSKDKLKPLFNRAISGAYPPGSTFKMSTALAGLESGVINTSTVERCTGLYTYFSPQNFKCWVYPRGHGKEDVVEAIKDSCNYFFYNVGRLTGIENMNKFGKWLGFGQKTGLELPNESTGVLAGREYRDSLSMPWYPGDTVQAAIGQSDNLLTPIQLANYLATLVNGGTRYQTTLIRKITDFHTSNESIKTPSKVLNKINIKNENYNAIMAGMGSVTSEGTAASVFRRYPIKLGGKTGTAEVSSGSNNGVFVAFAPYDDPQIAIAIVVEHGAHGSTIATVAKDILDEYFLGKVPINRNESGEMTLIP